MLAEEQALLVGGAERGGRARLGGDAPSREVGRESIGRAEGRAQGAGQHGARGIGHRAVNPGVGHVAADDGDLGLLGPEGVRKVRQPADTDLDPGQLGGGFGEELVDVLGLGRPRVVAGMDESQPGAVRPVGGRDEARAVFLRRVHGQEARAVRAFPPEEPRNARAAAGGVAAQMEKVHPGRRKERGHDPGVGRDVGHLGVAGQGEAGRTGEAGGEAQAADQVLGLEKLGMQGEGQGVDDEAAVLEGGLHTGFALGRLAGPIFGDLGHRPAGQRPDEAPLGREGAVAVDDVQRLVDHGGAIALHHGLGHVGIADIEVGLEDDDDLVHGGERGSRNGGRRGYCGRPGGRQGRAGNEGDDGEQDGACAERGESSHGGLQSGLEPPRAGAHRL